MANQKQSNLLPLRIRILNCQNPITKVRVQEAADSLAALRSQDKAYKCGNYPNRCYIGIGCTSNASLSFASIGNECREIMVDWCFKVCDHADLPLTREMVSVAFNILDRFLDRLPNPCNRQIYKLVAVTSFYISTKMMSSKQISIGSLVALGRGAFQFDEIQRTELQILCCLNWCLTPPTVQAILEQFRLLSPLAYKSLVNNAIYQRAVFLAELAVFDNYFVTCSRYSLAVSCFLNAIEFMTARNELSQTNIDSLSAFKAILVVDLCRESVYCLRIHLWTQFNRSAQSFDDCLVTHEIKNRY